MCVLLLDSFYISYELIVLNNRLLFFVFFFVFLMLFKIYFIFVLEKYVLIKRFVFL